jgi:hypothetical protein
MTPWPAALCGGASCMTTVCEIDIFAHPSVGSGVRAAIRGNRMGLQ